MSSTEDSSRAEWVVSDYESLPQVWTDIPEMAGTFGELWVNFPKQPSLEDFREFSDRPSTMAELQAIINNESTKASFFAFNLRRKLCIETYVIEDGRAAPNLLFWGYNYSYQPRIEGLKWFSVDIESIAVETFGKAFRLPWTYVSFPFRDSDNVQDSANVLYNRHKFGWDFHLTDTEKSLLVHSICAHAEPSANVGGPTAMNADLPVESTSIRGTDDLHRGGDSRA